MFRQIAFERPGVHYLPAFLLHLSELNEFAGCRLKPDLFVELNFCTLQQIFTLSGFAFRNCPRTLIFVSKEWAAGMNK